MSLVEARPIAVIALKELQDRLRSRWVLAVACIFTLFALVIAYFGAAQQGVVGMQRIEVTIANLVSLVVYLVPLIALILGYDAVVGERERGSLELLLSMPITRFEVLLGKFLGLAAALMAATVAGFGLAGLWLFREGGSALLPYFVFIASALLLGFVFLSLALLVSTLTQDRVRASGIAIALWFFFVLIHDLLLLGALVASGGQVGRTLFVVLLLCNPTDLFRILNVFGFDALREAYGLTTILPASYTDPWLLGGLMGLWILVPLALASWRFR